MTGQGDNEKTMEWLRTRRNNYGLPEGSYIAYIKGLSPDVLKGNSLPLALSSLEFLYSLNPENGKIGFARQDYMEEASKLMKSMPLEGLDPEKGLEFLVKTGVCTENGGRIFLTVKGESVFKDFRTKFQNLREVLKDYLSLHKG